MEQNKLDPKSLRIGSYLQDKERNIVEVIKIYATGMIEVHSDIHQFHDFMEDDNDLFDPIPLTEEILLKCGFDESLVSGWDYTIRLSALHLRARTSFGNVYFELEDIYLGDSNLKYLHQLQNLYFSLTGKELEIKL